MTPNLQVLSRKLAKYPNPNSESCRGPKMKLVNSENWNNFFRQMEEMSGNSTR
jgi:hypothetical protein